MFFSLHAGGSGRSNRQLLAPDPCAVYDVVENKPDDYLLTIMRSNVSLSSELVFTNASQSTSIVLTLMIEKLYDFYMKGKDVSVICEMIQEQLKRGD